MAIKTKEDIILAIKNMFPNENTDEVIALIEDVADTFDNINENNSENWKEKYEQNDAEWRKKYTDRFFNSGNENNFEKNENEEEGKPLSYDSLFKEC